MQPRIGQLLVHLDASPHSATRLRLARQLAGSLDASVTAMYAVTPGVEVPPYVSDARTAVAVAASLRSIDEDRLKIARSTFEATMQRPGVPVQWGATTAFSAVADFARQAMFADLLVLGQRNPDEALASGVPLDFPEAVMAQSGRPALVLPWTDPAQGPGNIAVVAWKATPQAARAVSAALPLLRRARAVHVLTWTPEMEMGANASAGAGADALSLESYLQVHGVHAQWHRYDGEPSDLGALLLSRIADLNADLLVMGCYSHSRAREWVLGGVSRTVLASMTVPVLMSH